MSGDITVEALRQCERASGVISPFIIFVADDPFAEVSLTYLFIWAAVQQPGRNVGRRMVVERSNCSRMGVES